MLCSFTHQAVWLKDNYIAFNENTGQQFFHLYCNLNFSSSNHFPVIRTYRKKMIKRFILKEKDLRQAKETNGIVRTVCGKSRAGDNLDALWLARHVRD